MSSPILSVHGNGCQFQRGCYLSSDPRRINLLINENLRKFGWVYTWSVVPFLHVANVGWKRFYSGNKRDGVTELFLSRQLPSSDVVEVNVSRQKAALPTNAI